MSEVYGINGKSKGREKLYTKEEIDYFTQTHCRDFGIDKYLYEVQTLFNEGISNIYLDFIGEVPILVIDCLTGGYSFKNKLINIDIDINHIPISTRSLKYIMSNIESYEATYCRFYGGSVFSMGAKLYPKINSGTMRLILEHHGHGESGAYQYTPTGTMTFVFGAIPN